ncbi:hypothetical protein V2I01_23415 [Micromonospora sp. BRA006-A]|nr:hypothetical protein [Micromonospora sp. BRA006-A]
MAVLTDRPAPVARRRDREPRARVNRFFGYAVLIFFGLVYLYPFVIQLGNSFKTEPDAAANPLLPIPDPITLAGFERIFAGTNFPLWLGNSVLVTVLVTVGRVFFASLAGYALARLRFRGRTGLFAAVIAVMAVPRWCCSSRSSWCSISSVSTTATPAWWCRCSPTRRVSSS